MGGGGCIVRYICITAYLYIFFWHLWRWLSIIICDNIQYCRKDRNRKAFERKKCAVLPRIFLHKHPFLMIQDTEPFIHCKCTVPKIRNKYFQNWNWAASFPIPRIANAKQQKKSDQSLTDPWMQKLGTRPRSFISGNICFEFSVQCTVLLPGQ